MNFGPTTTNPMDRRGRPTFEEQYDQMIRNKEIKEKGKEMLGKGVRMAGDALRSAFGGGAITGDSADRREPTEQIMVGNPMASPTAADNVRMPQDLQAGYMHMNRFGSPLPIHGLGTPARTAIASLEVPEIPGYRLPGLNTLAPITGPSGLGLGMIAGCISIFAAVISGIVG